MSTKFSITDNAVAQHHSNLGVAVESFNANLTKFGNSISNLEGVWQGSSYSSWNELTTAFNTAFSNLNKQLQEIQSRVGNADALYDQGLQEQTAHFKNANANADWGSTRAQLQA